MRSKLVTASSERQIEALIAFMHASFESNDMFDAEIVSAFIMNGIYDYAKHIVSLDVAAINNAPESAVNWQILARRMVSQIERYITKPIEGIIKL